ncbi:hypothetical protein ABB37_01873 [Leptomonas pyrrhocoris]|uniref:Uncharacterized protein n=1 Tax=Leptomonas pyrrhocoris TaxID=157538 RepID=A0A0M9G6Y7_LEPPY|nr:hypothetical protein ABB37_01873 [Leptomonas pyrrhocoris]KPA83589.1 hypothetical protein ABB37_01873 [Leptomonas pyrrhocoris]|eukprot:XP_015662028.1 hypothetical protein ABB37_01873 [Leptomonas pyrrhocoris]
MLQRSRCLLVRLPKTRRPRERPWEIFNTRDYGFHEGSQNYSMWFGTAILVTAMLGFEVYQQVRRVLQRGDSCPACEAAREHYRKRVEERDKEIDAARQHDETMRLFRSSARR